MGAAAGVIQSQKNITDLFGPDATNRNLTPEQTQQFHDIYPENFGSLGLMLSVLGSVLAGPLGPALAGSLGISNAAAGSLIAAAGGAAGGGVTGGVKGALLGGLGSGLGYAAGGALSNALGGVTGIPSTAVEEAAKASAGAGMLSPSVLAATGSVAPITVTAGAGLGAGAAAGGLAGSVISGLGSSNNPTSNTDGGVNEVDPITITASSPPPTDINFLTNPRLLQSYGNDVHNTPQEIKQTAVDTVGQTVGGVGADLGVGLLGQALGLTPKLANDFTTPADATAGGFHTTGGNPSGGVPLPSVSSTAAGPGGGNPVGAAPPIANIGGSGAASGGTTPGGAGLLSTGGAAAGGGSSSAPAEIKTQGSTAPDIYPWRRQAAA